MTETLTRNPFTTDNVTRTALTAMRSNPRFWTGWSGEPVTGHDVAEFIENTVTLLDVRGWVRNYQAGEDPQIPEVDESMSVKALLLAGLRALRSMAAAPGPLTLMGAALEIGRTSGDTDARVVADRVLDVLVAARTGSSTAQAVVWADKKIRIWDEVRGLLDAAAEFARTHGPR